MFTSLLNTCALPMGTHTDAPSNLFDIHNGYYNYMNNPGILNGVSVIYWEVETANDQELSQNTPPPDIISCHCVPRRSQEPTTYQVATTGQNLHPQSTKSNQHFAINYPPNFHKIRDKKSNREVQNKWALPNYLLFPREGEYVHNLFRSFTKREAAQKICRKIFEQIWNNFFRHIFGALEFNDQASVHFWVSSLGNLRDFRKMSFYADYSSSSRRKQSKEVSWDRHGEETLRAIQTDGNDRTGVRRIKCKRKSKSSEVQNFTNEEIIKSDWRTIGQLLRNVGDSFQVMNKKQPSWARLRVAIGFNVVGTILWSASLVVLSASAKLFFAQLK